MAIVAIPALVEALLPAERWIGELIAVFLPILAFFIRFAIGRVRFAQGSQRWWQGGLFFVGIFILVLFDAVLILFCLNPAIAQASDWAILCVIYLIYLALMSIALFPLATNDCTATA